MPTPHVGAVPYFRPSIDEAAIDLVSETLRSGWLTSGPQVKEFEGRFAQEVDASHAVAVNSCTAALHLALAAMKLGPGDEVIVPSMTFTATAEIVVHLGATPVLVDCFPDTLNIDPKSVEQAMTPATRAIIPVHYGGQPGDMDSILALAAAEGLVVVEDAAHAFTARLGDRKVGSIGDITCFSFYANKTITTGEGGMLTSEDAELIDRIRTLSLHGLSQNAWGRFDAGSEWDYSVLAAGYKYNMSDVAAALGLAQLSRAQEFRRDRQRVAEAYLAGFAAVPEVEPLAVDDLEGHAWHLFVIQLQLETLSISRNHFIDEMNRRGIATSVHYRPLHLHTYYRDTFGYTPEDLPAATAAFERIISIPIFPSMTGGEIDKVIDVVRSIVAEHRR